MKFFLQAEKALGITLGDEECPEGVHLAIITDFNRWAGKAAPMINVDCSMSVKPHINGIHNPYEMWSMIRNKLDNTVSRLG
jgi:hypothetical protein